MNYLGLLALLVAMLWTWNSPKDRTSPDLEIHVEIQNEIAQLIRSAVAQRKPLAETVHLDRLWTEARSDEQIDVSFRYHLKDGAGNRLETAAGEAKVDLEENGDWLIHSVKVNKIALEFEKSLSIGSQ